MVIISHLVGLFSYKGRLQLIEHNQAESGTSEAVWQSRRAWCQSDASQPVERVAAD
jgi:hypothetical protein